MRKLGNIKEIMDSKVMQGQCQRVARHFWVCITIIVYSYHLAWLPANCRRSRYAKLSGGFNLLQFTLKNTGSDVAVSSCSLTVYCPQCVTEILQFASLPARSCYCIAGLFPFWELWIWQACSASSVCVSQ